MEITFLGTAANNPSPVRGVSSLCLRHENEIWMFDCGECTQVQLMKSHLKPGKITKIFITHLHGDHVFGLPGLLCTIGQNVAEDRIVEIYGPVGIRRFIRTTLELSRSMVTYKYVVHELKPIDDQVPQEVKNWKVVENDDTILHPSEILGRTIEMNKQGFWDLYESELISIKSSWIKHRVATFGYVIEQKPLQGKLDVDALKKLGITPGPIFKKIKSGEDVVLENGQKLEAKMYVGPSRPGKKITILGDCYESPNSIIQLGTNSDILVHECTLENALIEKAISNGHSTPKIACDVANKMKVKCLILNHFSQRYKPINYESDKRVDNEKEEEEDDNVRKLLEEAKQDFRGELIASYDLYTHKII